ncbi:hypothetical protein I4U23_006984 [Adineta vaga]|nr:hypothetical protein I4U23_006984 [Adineta vaga]
MSKHRDFTRLSRSGHKPIDYRARKRLEELYLLTDELLQEQSTKDDKYDYKLYKKYKRLKEMNRKLQEKIINQHCSGCKCRKRQQSSEIDENDVVTFIDLTNSTETKNKQKNPSIDDSRKNEASSEEEDDSMDATDDIIEEVQKENYLANLPQILQHITRMKVKESNNEKNYLLKIGLYPALCSYLRNKSKPLNSLPPVSSIQSLINDHVKLDENNDEDMLRCVRREVCTLRRAYKTELAKQRDK